MSGGTVWRSWSSGKREKVICTPAFGLPAKYIFHAVCPAWHGGFFGEAKQLAGAYHSALELAAEYHCESVAFPLLSSGNYGYPKEQAFRIAVDTITQYVMEHDLTVYLVLYDRHSLAVRRKLFTSVEEYIDDHYVVQNDESYGGGGGRLAVRYPCLHHRQHCRSLLRDAA